MKLLPLILSPLLVSSLMAAEVDVPLETYAPKTGYHKAVGKATISLPEGWTYKEHNGTHYLIGAKDVYGFVSLAYSELGVMNFTSQFGTPKPPVTKVGDVEVYNQVKNDSGSFLRKLDGVECSRKPLALSRFQGEGHDVLCPGHDRIHCDRQGGTAQ